MKQDELLRIISSTKLNEYSQNVARRDDTETWSLVNLVVRAPLSLLNKVVITMLRFWFYMLGFIYDRNLAREATLVQNMSEILFQAFVRLRQLEKSTHRQASKIRNALLRAIAYLLFVLQQRKTRD